MAVLRHPLFDQVRAAERAQRCFRELPLIWHDPAGVLIEGTIDLAFEDGDGSIVVLDFKTDRELDTDLERYRRQLAIYCQALAALQRSGHPRDSHAGIGLPRVNSQPPTSNSQGEMFVPSG